MFFNKTQNQFWRANIQLYYVSCTEKSCHDNCVEQTRHLIIQNKKMIILSDIMLHIWRNIILKNVILMLEWLISNTFLKFLVTAKGNAKLPTLSRSRFCDLHQMYKRNQYFWRSLIKHVITHIRTNKLGWHRNGYNNFASIFIHFLSLYILQGKFVVVF